MGSDVRGGRVQEGGRPEFESHTSQARCLLLCSSGDIKRTQPDVGWESDGMGTAKPRVEGQIGAGEGGEEKLTPSRGTWDAVIPKIPGPRP